VDPEGRTLPAINFFGRGGFRIYERERGGGAMVLPTRLNSIPVPISRGMNYTDKIEYFLCHEKGYYLNILEGTEARMAPRATWEEKRVDSI
jgi:hypothetical protein